MILRSILCPVDFSEQSRHALQLAGALASRYQSRLVVLNVVDPLLAAAARARLKLDLAKEETEPALGEFVTGTWPGMTLPSLRPVLEVRVGNPADVILETAARDAIDCIVMSTQGLGGFRKWLLGSTTEHVLRRTHTPVLAVPPTANISEGPFAVGLVLATTDFTDSSFAAVKTGVAFARKFNVPLLLAHIVEPVSVPVQWRPLLEESDEVRLSEARTQLKHLAERCAETRVPETIVSFGHPADAITAIADERRAGLIVMGLTGDEGPFARRPGSMAYRVLCSAGVPVLIVPPSPEING